MGLFDFTAKIGRKLFKKDEDPAQKVLEHIEANNPGVMNLAVQVEEETAILAGTTKNQEAFEKVVLMAGNVEGIADVQADKLVQEEGNSEESSENETQYYEIQKGDTLWAIAKQFYNDGNKYTEIVTANQEVIIDADKIFPGQKIRIPSL